MNKITLIVMLCVISLSSNAFSQDGKVTAKELFEKVGEAVLFLMENGDAALEAMSQPAGDNPFIWKDTYIFTIDCPKKIIVTHPNPNIVNAPKMWNLKDPNGKPLLPNLCKAAAEHENGGWYDYFWPKKQSKDSKTTASKLGDKETLARKISFSIRVPGTDYTLGAGIYDDTLTVEELNAQTKEWMK
jgi:hypothetical protein